jgi:hypothetical protein
MNPEPVKDGEFQILLRGFLPPELAALRQPNADPNPAVALMREQVTELKRGTLVAKLEKAKIQENDNYSKVKVQI